MSEIEGGQTNAAERRRRQTDKRTTQTPKGGINTRLRHSTSLKIEIAKYKWHNSNDCEMQTATIWPLSPTPGGLAWTPTNLLWSRRERERTCSAKWTIGRHFQSSENYTGSQAPVLSLRGLHVCAPLTSHIWWSTRADDYSSFIIFLTTWTTAWTTGQTTCGRSKAAPAWLTQWPFDRAMLTWNSTDEILDDVQRQLDLHAAKAEKPGQPPPAAGGRSVRALASSTTTKRKPTASKGRQRQVEPLWDDALDDKDDNDDVALVGSPIAPMVTFRPSSRQPYGLIANRIRWRFVSR
jgi:hypothetical protein